MENNKNYTWSPSEEFTLTGFQVGTVNKFVDMVLNSEQAQIVLFAQQCKSIINETLKKGFEEGKLKEMEVPSVKATETATGLNQTVVDNYQEFNK